MEILLKNIYTFANVLAQSHTEAVASWDHRSLQNALKWASYCEKVHGQIVEKGYTSQFNTQLQSLTLCLSSLSCLHLDVDKLGIATQLIKKALFRNPYVNDSLVTELLDVELKSQASREDWIKTCSSVCEVQHDLKTVERLLYVLDPESGSSQKWRLISRARVLMDCLSRQYSMTNRKDRFMTYMTKILEECVKDENGLELLVGLLALTPSSENLKSAYETLQQDILSWLVKTSSDDKLLDVPVYVLVETSIQHFAFFKHYIGHLTKWANQMQPVYKKSEQNSLYTWRYVGSENRCDRSYPNLVCHFRGLYSTHCDTREALCHLLTHKTENSIFSIWQDLKGDVVSNS